VTHEQAEILTQIKRRHGRLRRISDDSRVGERLLSQCVSDTYAFECCQCHQVFTVEPDGEVDVWALVD